MKRWFKRRDGVIMAASPIGWGAWSLTPARRVPWAVRALLNGVCVGMEVWVDSGKASLVPYQHRRFG